MTTLFQQVMGKIQIASVSRCQRQFHQGQFYFLVPGHPMSLTHIEERHRMVCHTHSHIHQLTLARSLIIGHTGLYQVSCAVHLMFVHIRPAVSQSRERVIRVDVSVWLLGCGYLVHPFIQFGLQLGIAMSSQSISHALHSLIYVRIIEEDAAMLSLALSCTLKIAYPARLVLYLVYTHRQSGLEMPGQTRRPKGIVDMHMGKIHLINQFDTLHGFLAIGQAWHKRQGQGE